MDHRSPLDNIFSIIGGLPQGHDKPIKHALYNSLALFLLFVCCAALWALYLILEPFIKPLVWALLVGSVLHPIKHSLAQRFRSWFDMLDESRTPIIIGIFIIPVNIVNDLSEFIGWTLKKHWKLIVGAVMFGGLLHVVYFYTPVIFASVLYQAWICMYAIINIFITYTTTSLIVLIVVIYLSVMVLMWNPRNNKNFHYASMTVWLLLSCFVAKQFGSFQIPVFLLLQLVLLGGFVYEVVDIQEQLALSGVDSTIFQALKFALQGKENDELQAKLSEENEEKIEEKQSVPLLEESPGDTQHEEEKSVMKGKQDPWNLDLFEEKSHGIHSFLITDKGKVRIIKQPSATEMIPTVRRSLSQPGLNFKKLTSNKLSQLTWRRNLDQSPKNGELASDFYICTLLWGCGVMFFWKNVMFLPILSIPIFIYFTKRCGTYLGVWGWIYEHWSKCVDRIGRWCQERHDAIVPVPIRGLYRIIYKGNLWLKTNIKASIDTVASCVVILGLLVFVLCASIFIFVQVYAEAIMLVQMTSNVINQTVVHNPELRQLLPPTFETTVDSLLDNAYMYGREGISKGVKSMMNGVDPTKSERLERQVLELWDRIYQTWMSSDDDHGPKVTADAVQKSWDNFIDDIQKSPEMFNFNGIIQFINQNVGTLMSLMDSIWAIVKGNISLVLGSFSAILSVLLGGGTAVLNFILNMIIFLTTLFYLLSSSGDLYKPVEFMTQFSTNGSRFGLALGDAINGVFTASFKMATFYGLWTWFIHNLFNVKIVYLPSAIAAILGAAPFLGTYWACIPAVFDLWLAQEKSVHAILFAAVQFVPMSIVDATIYAEMKGGHPYLTGLAIAGGIFCLGLEGAIIGPLILCGLYVAINLSTTLFKDSPSEESMGLPGMAR